jgi:hypothetical protein
MNSCVSLFALFSVMLSLTQPAWSMEEDKTSENPHLLKRQREEDKQNPLPQPPLKREKQDEAAINPPLEEGEEQKIEDLPQPLKETDSQEEKQKTRKLTDIRKLRPYFDRGYLEINHNNCGTLLDYFKNYRISFFNYDRGVFVKNWKASVGFDSVRELLYSFTHIKSFKLRIEWDKEGDVTPLICQAIQFYENLETLDISNCHLTEANLEDVIKSIPYPDKLRSFRSEY